MTMIGPPAARPVTRNVCCWRPNGIVTLAGTVMTPAAPVWVMVTSRPPGGAGASMVTVKLAVPPTESSRVAGDRVTVYWPTNTVDEAEAPPRPGSTVAVTVTGPPADRASTTKP